MKKSRFVEFVDTSGASTSVHVDCILRFREKVEYEMRNARIIGCSIKISNGDEFIAQEPYETIKERINEAMS